MEKRTSIFSIFHHLWGIHGLRPLFLVKFGWLSTSEYFPLKLLGGIVAVLLTSTISEFFYYWFHRLQHANSFLWRFHSIHHSLRELSVWNSYHHFTEDIFKVPFFVLPISILIQGDPGYVPILFVDISSLLNYHVFKWGT